jgi:hypothetical protein
MTAVRIVTCLAALLALSSLRAAPLFEDTAVIDAVLEGPLGELMDSPDSREQLPFTLRVDGTEHAVKVRLRGKSRLRVCDFLPLRLNLKKGDVDGTLFAGQDKLKLVVPCHTSRRGEANLLEEYAVYRIFNLLTPASYQVRLLRMTFRDSAADGDTGTLHTFLLEPEVQLAERLGGLRSDRAEVALGWLDEQHMALVYVFQYLVGNVDWSLVLPEADDRCCHNGTLIETGAELLYVPYDFDLTGFVDAPYAFPPPDLRLKSVTQRRYRGFCTDRDYLRQALRTIVAKRPEIVDVVQSLPVLSGKDKASRIAYLDQFFRAAGDEERLLDRFERRCID